MRCERLLVILLLVGALFVPTVSAGFWQDMSNYVAELNIASDGSSEYSWPVASSYEGAVVNYQQADGNAHDWATITGDQYGKIVYSNSNMPFVAEYQAIDGAWATVRYSMAESQTFQISIISDSGVKDTKSCYIYDPSTTRVGVQFSKPINEYDTNNDGIVGFEVVHLAGEPELNIHMVTLYYTIDPTISVPGTVPEIDPVVEDTTIEGGSGTTSTDTGDSYTSVIDTLTGTDTERTTLLEPVYTVPGFESVFAIIGLLVVVWMVRRQKE